VFHVQGHQVSVMAITTMTNEPNSKRHTYFNVLLYRKDVIVIIIFFNAPVTDNGSSVCHYMDKSNAQEL
jgi:hypothetical protein